MSTTPGHIHRVLGLPGWFAPSVMDAPAALWIPRFGLEIAQTLVDELGPPRGVDVGLGISGRGYCLAEYETAITSRLLSFDLRAFIALWRKHPKAIEDTEPWRRNGAPLTLWLENTTAMKAMHAQDNSLIIVGQRNGRIKLRKVVPRTVEEDAREDR